MSEEEYKTLDKFFKWCHENSVVFFRDFTVLQKGIYNDTARGRRERFVVEREF